MTQFQIQKTDLAKTRFVEMPTAALVLGDSEIVVRVERFGFSSNNITYAVMGEGLSYWQFFPAEDNENEAWGVLPVWGFAEIVASNVEELPIGERLFGYFPPATHLRLTPIDVTDGQFLDGSAHRAKLPKGYNIYRRVQSEPGYTRADDDLRMLLFPLYVTSFCLWDMLKENGWYAADQIIIASASSKTSIGLAYALHGDGTLPNIVGLTSSQNVNFTKGLNIYNSVVAYDALADQIENIPTAIVDMSGNAEVLGELHKHLGKNMVQTINVGLTHWSGSRTNKDIIQERSEFFFAPSRIQKRMKDWGREQFNAKSSSFVMETARKSQSWLDLQRVQGVNELEAIYSMVRDGTSAPHIGFIVEL